MLTSISQQDHKDHRAADVLVPLIRAAATIGFAVAPCSLGFVIIAVSEHLIRSIMVGDDPEMLMSDLQNQFPNDTFEIAEKDHGLALQVAKLIDRPEHSGDLPLDVGGTEFQMSAWEALRKVPAGTAANYTFLAEQIGAPGTARPLTACQKAGQACANT
jgi:AraC family transcriptional regulator of adaptative response/methylated-DNA-[protein]-cysteine methyltransferase